LIMLDDSQKKKLLEIARNSIESYIRNAAIEPFEEHDPEFLKNRGAFVTINIRGDLRGCIGYIHRDRPLYKVVSDMAIEAASRDPRFPTITESELKDIHIEISALSEFKKVHNPHEIKVGIHGLMIKKGFYSGLLLPQVAVEHRWDREKFLANTCYKAGLPLDAWKKGAEIFIFSAEVFS